MPSSPRPGQLASKSVSSWEKNEVATRIAAYRFPNGWEFVVTCRVDQEGWNALGPELSRPLDAWVTPDKKCFIVDLVDQTKVSVTYPGGKSVCEMPYLKIGEELAIFNRAGAVMGMDDVIVVKDSIGLHYFNAKTDEFMYSSEILDEPYGLARLQNGWLATMAEGKLVIVNAEGVAEKKIPLPSEIVADLREDWPKAKIRFMCAGVRKDGVEAVYMVDASGSRIYALNAISGVLLWKVNLPEDEPMPRGIVALPNGKLIVARYKKRDLLVLDDNGAILDHVECVPHVRSPQGMYLREENGVISVLVSSALPVASETAIHEYQLPHKVLA